LAHLHQSSNINSTIVSSNPRSRQSLVVDGQFGPLTASAGAIVIS
jgi:hypothetical protein